MRSSLSGLVETSLRTDVSRQRPTAAICVGGCHVTPHMCHIIDINGAPQGVSGGGKKTIQEGFCGFFTVAAVEGRFFKLLLMNLSPHELSLKLKKDKI